MGRNATLFALFLTTSSYFGVVIMKSTPEYIRTGYGPSSELIKLLCSEPVYIPRVPTSTSEFDIGATKSSQ